MTSSSNHVEYTLQNFKVDPAVPHPTILLIGKRFSGKSTTSVAIASKYKVHRWAAWCGTKDTEDYWAQKFGSSASVWGPDETGRAALIRIIKYQQEKARLYTKVLKSPFPDKYSIGLIFDDVTSKRCFRKGEILEDLFSNGRHYKALIIISCQYIKQLPPAIRTNTDYLFMLYNTKRTCKILHEEFIEIPDDYEVFLQLMRAVVGGQRDQEGRMHRNVLIYNNCSQSRRLDSVFAVYQHSPSFNPECVRLGSPEWRRYNQNHFRDTEMVLNQNMHQLKEKKRRLAQHAKQQNTPLRTFQINNRKGKSLTIHMSKEVS